jgi:hypothetical protein
MSTTSTSQANQVQKNNNKKYLLIRKDTIFESLRTTVGDSDFINWSFIATLICLFVLFLNLILNQQLAPLATIAIWILPLSSVVFLITMLAHIKIKNRNISELCFNSVKYLISKKYENPTTNSQIDLVHEKAIDAIYDPTTKLYKVGLDVQVNPILSSTKTKQEQAIKDWCKLEQVLPTNTSMSIFIIDNKYTPTPGEFESLGLDLESVEAFGMRNIKYTIALQGKEIDDLKKGIDFLLLSGITINLIPSEELILRIRE